MFDNRRGSACDVELSRDRVPILCEGRPQVRRFARAPRRLPIAKPLNPDSSALGGNERLRCSLSVY